MLPELEKLATSTAVSEVKTLLQGHNIPTVADVTPAVEAKLNDSEKLPSRNDIPTAAEFSWSSSSTSCKL